MRGGALTQQGLDTAYLILGCPMAFLWGVIKVETSGVGFTSKREPVVLYERHIFHRLTNGKFDHIDNGDLSDPQPFYPPGQTALSRYERANLLDHTAAVQATSWGLGQILGTNYRAAGFSTPDDMVAAMYESEDRQLIAMCQFIDSTVMARALIVGDWQTFARNYNGPAYALNRYAQKLSEAVVNYEHNGTPDLRVRTIQLYLRYWGYGSLVVDGVFGPATQKALIGFQLDHGLNPNGEIEGLTLERLESVVL